MCRSEVAGQRLWQLLTTFVNFHQQLHSYQSGIVVLFSHYLSCSDKTYQLGTLGVGWTIFWVTLVILLLFWSESAPMSFYPSMKLNGSLQHWATAACLLLFQDHNWVVGSSYHITQKGTLRSFIQYTKEWPFQNKNQQQEQSTLDGYVPLLQTGQLFWPLLSWFQSCYTEDSRAWEGRWLGCITTTTITTTTLV